MEHKVVESHGDIKHHQPVMQAASGPANIEGVDMIEEEAKAIRQQLSSADRDRTRHLLEQLKMLNGRLPAHGRRARRSAGMIRTAITQAEQQLESLSDEELRRHDNAHARQMLAIAVYATLSGKAKQFVDQIDEKMTHEIRPVAENGLVPVAGKVEVVEASELKEHFSLIKYHTMSEADKKSLLSKTFGIERSADAVSSDAKVLRAELEEIKELHHSLRDMEAYKASMRIAGSHGRLTQSVVDIAMDHDSFAKAHAEVDTLMAAYERLIADPHNTAAIEALKQARSAMKKTLKDDIMDRILLGNSNVSALDVAPPAPNLRDIVMARFKELT